MSAPWYDEDEKEVSQPADNYVVVSFGDGENYGILPTKLVKEHHNVVTRTRTIETAEAYLADLTDDDDDPQCVCGTYRSEHSMMGCGEGFQRAGSWAVEREWIQYDAQSSYYDQFPRDWE
jgi:hypothetical protein